MKKHPEIPDGLYCYTYIGEYRYTCPYHRFLRDKYPQECGYCDFLKKGDEDFNREIVYEGIDNKGNVLEKKTADEIGIPMSLLWDMCKECGRNIKWEKEYEPGK
jgi:hypothetical protein